MLTNGFEQRKVGRIHPDPTVGNVPILEKRTEDLSNESVHELSLFHNRDRMGRRQPRHPEQGLGDFPTRTQQRRLLTLSNPCERKR